MALHSTRTKRKKHKAPRARVVVDTKTENLGAFDPQVAVTYQQELVCCGKKKCRRCKGIQHIHGPYWYAYFRTWEGRKKSIYIGKNFRSATLEEVGA